MQRMIRAALAALATGFLVACGGGGSSPNAARADLAGTLAESADTTRMADAVAIAGMTAQMQGSQEYTLLMPSDEALRPYADEMAELERPENRAALEQFVRSHMVDGKMLAEQMKAAADRGEEAPATITVRNLEGEELEIHVDAGGLSVNGARVQRADHGARNGVLHVFRAPLFKPSVFSIVRVLPQTSTLEAAIRAADLTDVLRGKGSFTLFAPTNAAFDKLLAELNLTAEQLLSDKPLLTQVLTYHVLASRVLAQQIDDGATPATVQGQLITLEVERGRWGFVRKVELTDARGRNANVVAANLRARNGVVHLIDRVILPTDMSIVDIASGNPDFSILVEAVKAAGLVDTLSAPGPYTVFAPTNAAFAKLLGELGTTKDALLADTALLTQVLTYHVLSGRVPAAAVSDGLAAASVQGQPLRFGRVGDQITITDANGRRSGVIATNIQASNGLIHVIDTVILPTTKTIVDVAIGDPDNFSILVEAVVAAGLADTLSSPGPFTVFAPTNAAFADLLTELGTTKEALLANTALLTQVLTYHVVPGQVLSSGIPFNTPISTVQGQTFAIDKKLRITDANDRTARIVATDVAASNGVVHVIDRVILPK